jgi:hypothetical protein
MTRIPLVFVLLIFVQLVRCSFGAATAPVPAQGNGKYIIKVKQQGPSNVDIQAVQTIMGINQSAAGYQLPFISAFVATLSDAQKSSIQSNNLNLIDVSTV